MKTSTEEIIKNAVANSFIPEQQINLILRRLNNGENINLEEIWNNPLELTDEQNKKGFDFLMNQWKTPKGTERKNNPFGYREKNILANFTGFEFAGTYENRGHHLPLYNCCGDNNSFQYYYNGKVNIVG